MNNASSFDRNSNLDCLRAIAISLVLFWHYQPIQIIAPNRAALLFKFADQGLTLFNFQVTLVAVPLFLLVSLSLFFQKAAADPISYFKKRVRRLVEVFCFWTGCQFVCYYFIKLVRPTLLEDVFAIDSFSFLFTLMKGGPHLPIIGGSVFYFLFALIVLVALSAVFSVLQSHKTIQLYCGGVLCAASLLWFEILNLNDTGLSYWRIDNFLVYIPTAYLLSKLEIEKQKKLLPFLCMFYLLFSLQDWHLRNNGFHIGAYSRISVYCGSTALFCAVGQIRNLSCPKFLAFLSKCSLGIFATHKYWYMLVFVVFQFFSLPSQVSTDGAPVNWIQLIIAVSSLAMTLSAVYFGRYTPFKRYLL